MGKIVISTNVSLDGVVQDPDGEEGFRLGGWFVQDGGKDLEEWGKVEYAEALRTAALLLGRRSDEWFGARWASRPGEWADRLNSLPKYVVSSTLEDPRWTNVTVLKGNVVDEVTKLKQELDGDIVVYASYQLGRTQTGVAWLATTATSVVAAGITGGKLVALVGVRRLLVAGQSLLAISVLLLTRIPARGTSPPTCCRRCSWLAWPGEWLLRPYRSALCPVSRSR